MADIEENVELGELIVILAALGIAGYLLYKLFGSLGDALSKAGEKVKTYLGFNSATAQGNIPVPGECTPPSQGGPVTPGSIIEEGGVPPPDIAYAPVDGGYPEMIPVIGANV